MRRGDFDLYLSLGGEPKAIASQTQLYFAILWEICKHTEMSSRFWVAWSGVWPGHRTFKAFQVILVCSKVWGPLPSASSLWYKGELPLSASFQFQVPDGVLFWSPVAMPAYSCLCWSGYTVRIWPLGLGQGQFRGIVGLCQAPFTAEGRVGSSWHSPGLVRGSLWL